MTERVAVGVDAGGTSTRVLVSQSGAIAGAAEGSGANPTTLGVENAADVILTVVRKALAGRKPASIVIGAAGAGRLSTAEALLALIGVAFPDANVTVEDDTAIALRAAIPDGPGIVLIAGTGSVAYAENGDTRVRAGGLGYLAGDEGSAFSIGLAAVKLYGRVLDGRTPADETTDLVARALAAPDRAAYLSALYDAPVLPATIAALAPSVLAFAGKGNRASTKIVQQAGVELGDLLNSVAKGAGLLEASPSIAFAGGLFAENSLLSFLLETRIIGDIPGALVVRGGDGAATGALRLAERRAAL